MFSFSCISYLKSNYPNILFLLVYLIAWMLVFIMSACYPAIWGCPWAVGNTGILVESLEISSWGYWKYMGVKANPWKYSHIGPKQWSRFTRWCKNTEFRGKPAVKASSVLSLLHMLVARNWDSNSVPFLFLALYFSLSHTHTQAHGNTCTVVWSIRNCISFYFNTSIA